MSRGLLTSILLINCRFWFGISCPVVVFLIFAINPAQHRPVFDATSSGAVRDAVVGVKVLLKHLKMIRTGFSQALEIAVYLTLAP